MTITLEVADYTDAQHWYLRLLDPGSGKLLADHEVKLDPAAWQYQAFIDLHGYLSQHAAPDDRHASEARLVELVGQWIGEHVLGAIAQEIVNQAKGESLVVRVLLPREQAGSDGLLFLPLELAYVGGKPLSVQSVSFVFDVSGDGREPARRPVEKTLRFLAVFSLPLGVGALNLRHERYRLKRSIREIAGRGYEVDLRVLQYGATRQELEKILDESPGWDIVHFSGHGLAASLILEKPDGSRDDVTTDELVELLRRTRSQLKWVTLSACLSAAATIDETLRWLGVDPKREAGAGEDAEEDEQPDDEPTEKELPALAQTLVRELDCAVLAMRYPVGDQFAIDLSEQVYRRVLDDDQPLPRALQLALPKALESRDCPPLSAGTVALFGRRALDIRLTPPKRPANFEPRPSGLQGFEREPSRFVGRVGVLTAARAALAPDSDRTGVLFHGMAGGGKTACALELAYQYEDLDRFAAFVWFQAPAQDREITTALSDFALAMERQLRGFTMTHVVDREEELTAFLPTLREVLARNSILIVVDNLESLLRNSGAWRDERWGKVVATLLSHDGPSRTVLTSRIRPKIPAKVTVSPGLAAIRFDPGRLFERAVHALTLDHAALLARQLPYLGNLLTGAPGASVAEREADRKLVARALRLVQGHPKLIELAEGQATSAEALKEHVERAEKARIGGEAALAAFFERGESDLSDEEFLETLGAWTNAALGNLPEDVQRVFLFLCCLEEEDRTEQVMQANWEDFLKRMAAGSGSDEAEEAGAPEAPIATDELQDLLRGVDPNDPTSLQKLLQDPRVLAAMQAKKAKQQELQASLDALLEPLFSCGLVERRTPVQGEAGSQAVFYGIHPGVAEAGREGAGEDVRPAVDAELAAYWATVFHHGIATETSGGGGVLVRLAGLRAAPYLMRAERWDEAAVLLERVLKRDNSAATVAALLPLLRRIAEATAGTQGDLGNRGVLSDALQAAGRWKEAEDMRVDLVEEAERREDWWQVSVGLGNIANIMGATGRSEAALEVVERMKRATQAGGYGPWTVLGDECMRLQILNTLGRYEEVLGEVQRLRQQTAELAETGDREELANPWNVREVMLDTGHTAALRLERWEEALTLNADILASKRDRGASDLERAGTRFNDYGPLLSLDRFADARKLLLDCRRVFDDNNDIPALGQLFGALAALEDKLGHRDRAVACAHDALRYTYLVGDLRSCTISHFNLASYIMRLGDADAAGSSEPASALAHRLAAALIRHQTQDGELPSTLQVLARHQTVLPDTPEIGALTAPDGSGFDAVVRTVEQVPGVRFAELFAMLPIASATTGPEALAKVLELAARQGAGGTEEQAAGLEPILQVLAQAAAEGPEAFRRRIDEIRQALLEANPGETEQIDAFLEQIRTAIESPEADAE